MNAVNALAICFLAQAPVIAYSPQTVAATYMWHHPGAIACGWQTLFGAAINKMLTNFTIMLCPKFMTFSICGIERL